MVLLFSTNNDEFCDRIRRITQDLLPKGKKLEISRDIKALSERLRRPHTGLSIALLLLDSRDEWTGLLSLKGSFKDIDIMLILPDSNSDSIIKGCKLYPRYVGYKNDNLSDFILVLAKMIKKHQSHELGDA